MGHHRGTRAGTATHGRTRALAVAVGLIAALAVACGPPPDPSGPTFGPGHPITLGDGGVPGNASARSASTSADGVWTAFISAATNLVAGDTNGLADLFLRNNASGVVTRIATDAGDGPTMSRNGRYVGFEQVEPYGTYGVYDRLTGTTDTWSVIGDVNAPSVTDDGTRAVHGLGGTWGLSTGRCVVRDLVADTSTDCPPGGPGYGTASLLGVSGNARFAFYHWNDQSGGGTSGHFVLDVLTGDRRPVSGSFFGIGVQHVVADDGSTVLGLGFGETFPALIHDVDAGTSTLFPGAPDRNVAPIGFSPDGRYAAIATDSSLLDPDDTNDTVDVYLLDRTDDSVTRVSTSLQTGAQLTYGALYCGRGQGQVLDGGRVCILGLDEISVDGTNGGWADAYLTAPRS